METILEHKLVNSYKAEMISYMKAHPKDFDEAITLAISNKQPYSWKAAWILWSCMSKNDTRIRKYLKKIIETIPSKKDNQQRELLMILLRMELNNKNIGQLFDICLTIWSTISKNASLRYNAFKLLVKLSKNYPDLAKEIHPLTESYYTDNLSNSVKKSIFKLTKELIK